MWKKLEASLYVIYSTYASGAKQMSLKQIIQIKHYMVKNRFGSEVNQLAIYKRLRIWTRGLQIARPVL